MLNKKSSILGISFIINEKEYKHFPWNKKKGREELYDNVILKGKDRIIEAIINEYNDKIAFKPKSRKDPRYLYDPDNNIIVCTVDEHYIGVKEFLFIVPMVITYLKFLFKRKHYDISIFPWISILMANLLYSTSKRPIGKEEIVTELFLAYILYLLGLSIEKDDVVPKAKAFAAAAGFHPSFSLFSQTEKIFNIVKDCSNGLEFIEKISEPLLYSNKNIVISSLLRFGNDIICALDEPSYLATQVILEKSSGSSQITKYVTKKIEDKIVSYLKEIYVAFKEE